MRRSSGASERMSDPTPHIDAGTRAPPRGVVRAPRPAARPPRAARQPLLRRRLPAGRDRAARARARGARVPAPRSRWRSCSRTPRSRAWSCGAARPTSCRRRSSFVPMLLLLPTPYVPLLVAAGLVLARARVAIQERKSLRRSALAVTDAWFSLGPAVVLILLGAELPELGHWPVYVAALGAQIVTDGVVYPRLDLDLPGDAAARRPPRPARGLPRRLPALPVGLLAALAAADAPFAALLVLPLVYLLLSSRASARRACATRSSSAARTAAPRCSCATCSRTTTSTPAGTRRTWSSSPCGSPRRWASTRTRGARRRWARCCTTSARSHVPDEIINKPGPLDDAEWEIMKQHTV